jgi:hypothetical protein
MSLVQRAAAISSPVALYGCVAALCWIGGELHAIATSARYVDPIPAREAAALDLIAARLDQVSVTTGGADIAQELRGIRESIAALSLSIAR